LFSPLLSVGGHFCLVPRFVADTDPIVSITGFRPFRKTSASNAWSTSPNALAHRAGLSGTQAGGRELDCDHATEIDRRSRQKTVAMPMLRPLHGRQSRRRNF
jgi:hypothetical protein